MRFINIPVIVACSLFLSACGGGSSDGGADDTVATPAFSEAAIPYLYFDSAKVFTFEWSDIDGATYYQLLENKDGQSGYEVVSDPISVGSEVVEIKVPVFERLNARYILQTCDDIACLDSREISIDEEVFESIGYFKSGNTDAGDQFGWSVAVSDDGSVIAVGATGEDSNELSEFNNAASGSGAVYIFDYGEDGWVYRDVLKASVVESGAAFGSAVSVSGDGNTLAVGAYKENGEDDNFSAGAVHIFTRENLEWTHSAKLRADNHGYYDFFGRALSLSGNGTTLAVAAPSEDSSVTGISAGFDNDYALDSGAVYIFQYSGVEWNQEAFLKASDSNAGMDFGSSVSLSDDGSILAVGAIGGNGAKGAAYIFSNSDGWVQEQLLTAGNANIGDRFGWDVSFSGDGTLLAVSATLQAGASQDPDDLSGYNNGAVYLFSHDGDAWFQDEYLKASNTDEGDVFGSAISLNTDGSLLAVGSQESSAGKGFDADASDNSAANAGAAYLYKKMDGQWVESAYLKAKNTDAGDYFGTSIAISGDGNTLVVGASEEQGSGADQDINDADAAGAVYIY
ncbi:FG-GAP repeat protein [Microbulbifer sp. VAAF005]|uniref:FG-GAP repeat protein n=1 Tax=Microbulbifer sp. VAAF005 TaxID=3034230 RepID=UPI0024AD8C05|nr:FG-GAP repeat protein [Microbulbifer sp. VAAF005]WHI47877.1 histidine kinase [Microbulbifer sp. VAAF005]